MDLGKALLNHTDSISPSLEGNHASYQSQLLDWVAGAGFVKVDVSERELTVREKYFRFGVQGIDGSGKVYVGFGRSKDRLTAATIAACEMIERYVSRGAFRQSHELNAPFTVRVDDGAFDLSLSSNHASFPSVGMRSSNGWAVHFSAETAIENAVREALERHILLLTYLKYGWSGFWFDEVVPFESVSLRPGIARISAGGFKAGIVLTEGKDALGMTFGYLCRKANGFEASTKWLSAFFESYEQWVDLAKCDEPKTKSVIEKYQWHFWKEPRPVLPASTALVLKHGAVCGNIAVYNLQVALGCPVPLYAAFAFGRDFVPLFFKQKLSQLEQIELSNLLKLHGLNVELPEYHPIL
mgnify:CR=1 FL=1